MVRVAALERRGAIARVSALALAAVASLSALVASCAYVWNVSASSGLGEFVALIFSDWSAALAFSKELGLSILESLPAVGIALALSAGLALAWSLYGIARGIIKQNQLTHTYNV